MLLGAQPQGHQVSNLAGTEMARQGEWIHFSGQNEPSHLPGCTQGEDSRKDKGSQREGNPGGKGWATVEVGTHLALAAPPTLSAPPSFPSHPIPGGHRVQRTPEPQQQSSCCFSSGAPEAAARKGVLPQEGALRLKDGSRFPQLLILTATPWVERPLLSLPAGKTEPGHLVPSFLPAQWVEGLEPHSHCCLPGLHCLPRTPCANSRCPQLWTLRYTHVSNPLKLCLRDPGSLLREV
jgi:hypothetical protein